MKKVKVFLADGFEEIEGLTVVDLLRRAGIEVKTVSITNDKLIHGAHGIDIMADEIFAEAGSEQADMLVLPGGMPGSAHLQQHEGLRGLLTEFNNQKKYIAAICAAPGIIGQMGMLEGRRAASFPGVEDQLWGAQVVREAAVTDGHIITSRGLGTAIDFSLAIITVLINRKKADEIGASVIYKCGAQGENQHVQME